MSLVVQGTGKMLGAETLDFVSNVPGVLAGGELVRHLSPDEAEALIADGTIAGGMIPKVKGALNALKSGIGSVRIVSGQTALWNDGQFTGTAITSEED